MKILRAIAGATLVVAMALSLSAIGVSAAPGPITMVKTSGAATVAPGDTITYNISLRNNGDATATGLVLSDILSANTSFVSSSITPASNVPQSGGTTLLTFNISDLAASASSNLTITARVASTATAGTIITNTATLRGSNVPDATSNTSAVVVVATPTPTPTITPTPSPTPTPNFPVIRVTKMPNASATTAGSTLTYDITVRNVGGVAATGVIVSDILDPATTFISANPTPTTNVDGTFTYAVGVIAPGEAFSFTSQVRVNDGTPVGTAIDNRIRVTSANAATVDAPSAVIIRAAGATPTPSVSATPTPSASPIVLGVALPRTGVGEVFVWVLVALLALTLWPLLTSRKTGKQE